jgi:hypothetical protein
MSTDTRSEEKDFDEYVTNKLTIKYDVTTLNVINQKSDEIIDIILKNQVITELNIKNKDYNLEYIKKNKSLRILDIRGDPMSDKQLKNISKNKTIKNLEFGSYDMTCYDLSCLSKMKNLNLVHINMFDMTDKNAHIFKKLFVDEIMIDGMNINPYMFNILFSNISASKIQITVKSYESQLKYFYVNNMLENLSTNHSLTHIYLINIRLYTSDMECIFKNDMITHVGITAGEFNGEALRNIVNSNITNLVLNKTNIGDIGCMYIARSPKIKAVELSFNNITDVGVGYLSMSTTIQHLCFNDKALFDSTCKYLGQNKSITTLQLGIKNTSSNINEGLVCLAKNGSIIDLSILINDRTNMYVELFQKNKTLKKFIPYTHGGFGKEQFSKITEIQNYINTNKSERRIEILYTFKQIQNDINKYIINNYL